MEKEQEELNKIGSRILDASVKVHQAMGAGLLESVYEECLVHELRSKKHKVRSQVGVPLSYKGQPLQKEKLWIDLLVQNQVIIEVKATETVHPVHKAQLLSYLRLTELRLG